jgi:hypothetical protein
MTREARDLESFWTAQNRFFKIKGSDIFYKILSTLSIYSILSLVNAALLVPTVIINLTGDEREELQGERLEKEVLQEFI